MLSQINKRKKGVSLMIGYVLLVSLAIVMGGILYIWMKSYVPKEDLACPDGTSLIIESYSYNCSNLSTISINFKNNGRFDLAGYFIKASNNPNLTLAPIEFSGKLLRGGNEFVYQQKNAVLFKAGNENSFQPNNQITNKFDSSGIGLIKSIEIIPTRWETQDNKLFFASCGETSKYKEAIKCT
jgi:hypothetical protein